MQRSLVRVRQRVRGDLVAMRVGFLHRRAAARVAALLAHKLQGSARLGGRLGWVGDAIIGMALQGGPCAGQLSGRQLVSAPPSLRSQLATM